MEPRSTRKVATEGGPPSMPCHAVRVSQRLIRVHQRAMCDTQQSCCMHQKDSLVGDLLVLQRQQHAVAERACGTERNRPAQQPS